MRLFYLFLILVFISCDRTDVYLNIKANNKTGIKADIKFENYSIPIDSITLNYYSTFSNFNINRCDYIAGYNSKLHSIDVFNLTNKTFSKHLVLKKEGPCKLGNITGMCFINWDSIIIYSDYNIIIADSSGKINFKRDLSKIPLKETGLKRTLSSTYSTNIFFSQNRKSVFLIHTPRNVKFCSKSFYKIPFLAEYVLATNTLKLVPIHYSNFFLQKNSVGFAYYPYVRLVGDKLIYCFTGESNIYSFDLETMIQETYGARSEFTKNTTTTIPFNSNTTEKLRHEIENVLFLNVTYDPYRDIFYRFHYGELRYQVSANEYNTFLDKKLYLMIFDNKFRLIDEIKLDDHTYNTEFYGITQEGLLLNANHKLKTNYSDNLFQLTLLKINIIDDDNI